MRLGLLLSIAEPISGWDQYNGFAICWLGECSGDKDKIGTKDHSLFPHGGVPDSMAALSSDSRRRRKSPRRLDLDTADTLAYVRTVDVSRGGRRVGW